MKYSVELKTSAAKALEKLPKRVIAKTIDSIRSLRTDPFPNGTKKLKGTNNKYRIRIGEYRIVYGINRSEQIITVYIISHRSKAY